MIFTIIALLLHFKEQKRVSGGFLGRRVPQRHSKLSKSSWNGVNRGLDTSNPPGVSTHARCTRRIGLFLLEWEKKEVCMYCMYVFY